MLNPYLEGPLKPRCPSIPPALLPLRCCRPAVMSRRKSIGGKVLAYHSHHWHDENDESGYVGLALLWGQGSSKPTFQQRPEHFEIAQELEYPYNVTNGGVRDQTLRQNAHTF